MSFKDLMYLLSILAVKSCEAQNLLVHFYDDTRKESSLKNGTVWLCFSCSHDLAHSRALYLRKWLRLRWSRWRLDFIQEFRWRWMNGNFHCLSWISKKPANVCGATNCSVCTTLITQGHFIETCTMSKRVSFTLYYGVLGVIRASQI